MQETGADAMIAGRKCSEDNALDIVVWDPAIPAAAAATRDCTTSLRNRSALTDVVNQIATLLKTC